MYWRLKDVRRIRDMNVCDFWLLLDDDGTTWLQIFARCGARRIRELRAESRNGRLAGPGVPRSRQEPEHRELARGAHEHLPVRHERSDELCSNGQRVARPRLAAVVQLGAQVTRVVGAEHARR